MYQRLYSRRMQTASISVSPTKVGLYTRPLWDMGTPYVPKEIGVSPLFVDFEGLDLETAISSAGLRRDRLIIDPVHIPPRGSGRCWLDIIEFGIGKEVATHELLRQVIVGRRCFFCPPLAVVLHAVKTKQRVLEHPLAVLFTASNSRLARMVIGGSPDDLWIETDFTPDSYVFSEDTNFLAVDPTNRQKR
jgi:hypothetical protein